MTPNISYEPWMGCFVATDSDSYDGAEDAGPRAHCMGHGSTEELAIEDLKEQLAEYDEVQGI
jgi:hypothetical protein